MKGATDDTLLYSFMNVQGGPSPSFRSPRNCRWPNFGIWLKSRHSRLGGRVGARCPHLRSRLGTGSGRSSTSGGSETTPPALLQPSASIGAGLEAIRRREFRPLRRTDETRHGRFPHATRPIQRLTTVRGHRDDKLRRACRPGLPSKLLLLWRAPLRSTHQRCQHAVSRLGLRRTDPGRRGWNPLE
jgi:hypothetical protein